MVTEKDLIKMMKAEANKITPDSFDVIKTKLSTNPKYLEIKLNGEGEKFVPNDVEPIKDEISLKTVKKPTNSWIKGLNIGVAAAAAACAIIIPVTVVATQPEQIKLNDTSVNVSLKEYASLDKQSVNESNTINFTCTLDNNTNVSLDTLYSKTTNGKMAISVAKNSLKDNSECTIKDFIKTLVSETKTKFFTGQFGYNVDVEITSSNNELINEIKNDITDLVDYINTIYTDLSLDKYISDKLLNQNEDVYYLLLNDLTDYLFDKCADYNYSDINVSEMSDKELKELYDELIKMTYQVTDNDSLNSLQNDLENIEAIYDARKQTIQTIIDEYVNECDFSPKMVTYNWWEPMHIDLKHIEREYNDFVRDIEYYKYNQNDSKRKHKEKFEYVCYIYDQNELWHSGALELIKNPNEINHNPDDRPHDWSSHDWRDNDFDWDQYYIDEFMRCSLKHRFIF